MIIVGSLVWLNSKSKDNSPTISDTSSKSSTSEQQISRKTSKQISVDAQYMWTDTTIDLKQGDFVSISATGKVTATTSPGDAANKWVGPDGWGYQPQFNNQGKPNRWIQVLGSGSSLECMTGKVGENGAPFKVGSSYSFTANQSGRLYLGVNHVVSDVEGNRLWSNNELGRIWKGSAGNFDARIDVK